jgi:hypothetical protein
MTATTIAVTLFVVVTASALGTMAGAVIDQTRHHQWAMIVALTVSALITMAGLAAWWLP